MLSSLKKSPVEQETIGCYSIFQVGSLRYYHAQAMNLPFQNVEFLYFLPQDLQAEADPGDKS